MGKITDKIKVTTKKDRIALYLPEGMKKEWNKFTNDYNFPTLSKLIRDSVSFYIEYKSKIKNHNVEIDLLSSLSHDLKEQLTPIKAYLQLIIEKHGNEINGNVIEMLKSISNNCITLENTIIENLDNLEKGKDNLPTNKNNQIDILIIEDDTEIAEFLLRYFETKGYKCKGEISGFKALNLLRENIPKVILLDIILPDISGYEVLRLIKSNDLIKEIPVFILTALPSSEVNKTIQGQDVDGIIFKPFNLDDFKVLYRHLNSEK